MTRGRCSTMLARRATAQRTVLLVGRDLHEAERVRRLLPWRGGGGGALAEMRELSAARRLALILSRCRGERGDPPGVPVVERPYRIEEILAAMPLASFKRGARRGSGLAR